MYNKTVDELITRISSNYAIQHQAPVNDWETPVAKINGQNITYNTFYLRVENIQPSVELVADMCNTTYNNITATYVLGSPIIWRTMPQVEQGLYPNWYVHVYLRIGGTQPI